MDKVIQILTDYCKKYSKDGNLPIDNIEDLIGFLRHNNEDNDKLDLIELQIEQKPEILLTLENKLHNEGIYTKNSKPVEEDMSKISLKEEDLPNQEFSNFSEDDIVELFIKSHVESESYKDMLENMETITKKDIYSAWKEYFDNEYKPLTDNPEEELDIIENYINDFGDELHFGNEEWI